MTEVSKEQKDTFYFLVKKVFQNLLPQIQKHIDAGKKIDKHSDYPLRVIHSEGRWPSTSTTDLFRYQILNEGVNNYSTIISIKDNSGRVSIDQLIGFKELYDFVCSNEEIKSRIWYSGQKEDYSIPLFFIIGALVDRYITKNNNTIFLEESFKDIYDQVINSYFKSKLHLDICVPILMCEFNEDLIEISEYYSIERMSDEFIKSKYYIGDYKSFTEKLVLDCATHMLVIKGFMLNNNNYRSYFDLNNLEAYPIEIINSFFGALRSCARTPIGYAQIVCRPNNNWIGRETKGNLMGLTGARAQKYPDAFLNYYWHNQHSIMPCSIKNEVKQLFLQLLSIKSNALSLAIDRLNRSVLRNNEEDSILDAVIGLELLLTDNDKGELTYKISTRMAALSTLDESIPYSPFEVKESLKKIYKYRSDIVHSRKPRQETKNIKVNEKVEIEPIELAIDYLRDAIRILAKYPQYLDVKKIDELIMKKLEGPKS